MVMLAAGAPPFLERWAESFDRTELAAAGTTLGLNEEPSWRAASDHLPTLQARFRLLPETVTYDDFALENLAVSRTEPRRAIVFDYGEVSIGPAVTDWRNARWSLEAAALRGFDAGFDRPSAEAIALDQILTTLFSLVAASRRPRLPSWTAPLINDVRFGKLAADIAVVLDT
mgnify:CR=1 FL=1